MKARPIHALLATALAAIPASAAWIAIHGSTTSNAAPPPAISHTSSANKKKPAHKSTAAVTHTYTGPSIDMMWGPVQVTIIVKSHHITDVQASAPTERARSAFINQQAIPMLRQEVLQAQSASVYGVGGATMTSDAYAQSLQAAVDQARAVHTL